MFQPVSLFIGYRYSRSRHGSGFVSFITFFSIAGILLGVASLITVVSVMNGFEGELKKRILGVVPHVIVNHDKSFTDWQKTKEEYLSLEGVSFVTPVIESEAIIQSSEHMQMIQMQGVYPKLEKHNIIATHMVRGELADLSQYKYGLILGQALAQRLNVTRGSTVRLILPNQSLFTPVGRVPMQRKFKVVGVFNVGSQVDDTVIYLHAPDANKMLRKKAHDINKLRLYLADAFKAESIIEQLPDNLTNYQHTLWNESQGALFAAVGMEKNMMSLSLILIIAVAAFNIVSALVMVVVNKQGEISILQTFGMDRAGIIKIFISQGVINGLWGAVLGTILGVLLTLNLNDLLALFGINLLGAGYGQQQLPIALSMGDVLTIAISALLMSFLATLYPAYRASKTLPAQVLRHE